MKNEGMVYFDLLVINLYPFQDTINKVKDESKIIEMIDIGGNSLIRAAVKNYQRIAPITDPNDYEAFIKSIL